MLNKPPLNKTLFIDNKLSEKAQELIQNINKTNTHSSPIDIFRMIERFFISTIIDRSSCYAMLEFD